MNEVDITAFALLVLIILITYLLKTHPNDEASVDYYMKINGEKP